MRLLVGSDGGFSELSPKNFGVVRCLRHPGVTVFQSEKRIASNRDKEENRERPAAGDTSGGAKIQTEYQQPGAQPPSSRW
jgi:hypothetical protein